MQPRAGSGGAHAGGTGDDEAPKDPGARITHQSYTEKDYEGKRHQRIFLERIKINRNQHKYFFILLLRNK